MHLAILSSTDLATVIVVCLVLVVAMLFSHRRLSIKIGSVTATVNDINRAVNCVNPGEPPMVDRVRSIESKVGKAETASVMHAERLSSIGRTAREAKDVTDANAQAIHELRNLVVIAIENRENQ